VALTPVAPGPAESVPNPAEPGSPPRIAIAEAVKAYLAVRSGSGIVSATLRKHKTFVKQLEAFAAARGYVMLEQLTSTDIDMFFAGWKLGARAKAKGLRNAARVLSILRETQVGQCGSDRSEIRGPCLE
jgi:hypothetical protein